MINRIKSNFKFAIPELKALLEKNLAEFVYKDKTEIKDEIIVFSFHTPNPTLFDKQVHYLVENGYNLITTKELHKYILESKEIPPKSVMLTFDDCRASLWTTVYPIFKKYGVKGTAYLAPYFILQRGEKRPFWDEVTSSPKHVDISSYPFSSWEEIGEMHNSGIIDFQGHTYYHELIFVSSKIKDFINPKTIMNFSTFDIPLILEGEKNRYERQLPLGTPIYETLPRMGGKNRYRDDQGLRKHCVNYVKEKGEAFLKTKNWKKKVFSEAKRYIKTQGNSGSFESHEEMRAYLKSNLSETRKTIEKMLPGKKVISMCFPWEVGSDTAIKAAKDAGYRSCVWGIIPNRKTNNVGCDPYHICRLSSDFIFRLPGKGRISFHRLIGSKIAKRVKRVKR